MSRLTHPAIRAILLLIVAGGAALSSPAHASAGALTITIRDGYDPDAVTVAPGTTVTWVNASGNRHRVRTTSAPVKIDSGNIEPGERFRATLTSIGTYAYRDDREPDDRSFWATITVRAGSSGPGATSDSMTGGSAVPKTASVGMAGRAFSPSSVTILTGGTVAWRNDDDREHSVTSTTNAFDSGVLGAGGAYEHAFSTQGTYAYRCVVHPEMTGTVVVRAATTADPATPASSPSPPPSTTPSVTPSPSPSPTPTTPAGTGPPTVRVVDFAFQPQALTVEAGTTVSVVNTGVAPHTITAVDGSFDSGTIAAEGTWSTAFETPGSFAYRCAIHPEMTGTVEVTTLAPGDVPPSASPGTAADPSPDTSPAAAAAPVGSDPGDPTSPVSQPSDAVGLVFGIALTAVAVVLFGRTIGGVARRATDA